LPLVQADKIDNTASPASDPIKSTEDQLPPQLKNWQKRLGL
jgi:hypothetical protein